MKELKNKTEQEIKDMISDKRKSLFDFRIGLSGSKTRNVKALRNTKKDIARMFTELSLRKLNK